MNTLDLLYRYSCKLTWVFISAINVHSILTIVSNGTFGSDRIDAFLVIAAILSLYKVFKG